MKEQVWHALSLQTIASSLATDAKIGLEREEVEKRQKTERNAIPEPKREGFLGRLSRQFQSPIAILLVLAALATIFLSDYTDALVIIVALMVNVVMGIVQEGRASRAFDALRKNEAKYAVVIRNGEPAKVLAEELVAGDLVALLGGTSVPADIRLTEIHGLSVNEAQLSGEWLPVEKSLNEVAGDAALVERGNMVYAGTLIVSGAGKGIVVATGGNTELGRIAADLAKEKRVETPLMRDIKQVARFIVIVVSFVMVGIITLGLLRGLPLGEVLFTAIALAVASVPEGLPAAVTVVLALGMERILKAGGLVRNLLAAETLGTTSIILTDKTGTLTEGQMSIHSYITYSGIQTDAKHPEARRLLEAAVLASNAYVEEKTDAKEGEEKLVAHGRPIEQAIVLEGLKAGIARSELISNCPQLDELQFDSARRFGGKIVRDKGTPVAYISGAPETLLMNASSVMDTLGNVHVFTKEERERFLEALSQIAREGKRVIGSMRVPVMGATFPKENIEQILSLGTFMGCIVFSDSLRPEVKQAIADIQEAGARVLMLTGDNPETALAIAREVGIAGESDRAYTGKELHDLTDDELLEVLQNNYVFARVAPEEKLRIANVLVSNKEVVAMTGDGVNDAPALGVATIGVAVGSGTDVAKEASDLVLLTNGFSVITAAIREGRRLRDNFKKIFAYMLSTNFSEVILITFSLIFGLPLPILATQILWSNLIEGGLMNFAFAFEPLYPFSMKRKPTDPDVANVLSARLIKLILFIGCITAAFLIGIYLWLIAKEVATSHIQSLMFVAVSINCVFMAFSMKSFGTPLWKLPLLSNKFLLVALCASTLMLFAALYVPALQILIHTTPPTVTELGLIFGFGLVNLATIEIGKWFFFMRGNTRLGVS